MYREVSGVIRGVFYRYTDLVEPLSLEEVYLDVADSKQGPPRGRGSPNNGKQNQRCRECDGQFVLPPTKKVISDDTKRQIDNLSLEKLPLAGIARATEVS